MLKQRLVSIAYMNDPRIAAIPEKVADSGLKTKARVNSLLATVAWTGTILPLSLTVTFLVVVKRNPRPSFAQSCISVQCPLADLRWSALGRSVDL